MTSPQNPRRATLRIVLAVLLLTALYVLALRWPALAGVLHQAGQ